MLLLPVLYGCAKTDSLPKKPIAPSPETAPGLVLDAVSFAALPGWAGDDHAKALPAFFKSCDRFLPQPPTRQLDNLGVVRDIATSKLSGKIADWLLICRAARTVAPGDSVQARTFFETWFTPYLARADDQTDGLFTGYYEAELHGSRTRHGPYQYPLYARPSDLITVNLGNFRTSLKGRQINGRVKDGRLVPYYTRDQIDQGALNNKGLELFWVNSLVDAFFLHIQGSGRVTLDDGGVVRVGYAGRNGHRYVSIGREMINQGLLPRHNVSMRAIRKWIAAHPGEGVELLAANPSYVFFSAQTAAQTGAQTGAQIAKGPTGAQGAPLTPGRSLAIDRRFVPYGVPLWLDTTWPNDLDQPLRRLVVAQDTGGAITGPVRGDLFWGYGPRAARLAGSMKQSGRYYLLLPKATASRTVSQHENQS